APRPGCVKTNRIAAASARRPPRPRGSAPLLPRARWRSPRMTPSHDATRPIHSMSASAYRGRRGSRALVCRPLLALSAAVPALLGGQRRAEAAPEAHVLRIDPRASTADGSPVLTTVLEVVQNKRLSDITRNCAALTGDANLDCIADAIEQPSALYSSF